MSPGEQSSARQMASSVEKRTARALPVLRTDRLASVMPTRSLNSLSDILRRVIITSRLTTIMTLYPGLRSRTLVGIQAVDHASYHAVND